MGETTDEVRSIEDRNHSKIESSRVTSLPQSNEAGTATNQEATQIRSGIEETRSHLSATIDALQDKLDPTRIAEQVKEQIREKASEAYDAAKDAVKQATIGKAGKIVSNVSEAVTDMAGRAGTAVSDSSSSVVQYIRDNPVPFALLSIGVGMLAMNKRGAQPSSSPTPTGNVTSGIAGSVQSAASTVADTARTATERTTNAVSSAVGSVKDAASSATDMARQQFHNANDQARQGARAVSDRYNKTMQDSPLTVGIAAFAAGALVGMTIPTTQIESQYMGPARDHLIDQAKSVAQETVGKVGRITEEASHTLKDAAQKEGLVSS